MKNQLVFLIAFSILVNLELISQNHVLNPSFENVYSSHECIRSHHMVPIVGENYIHVEEFYQSIPFWDIPIKKNLCTNSVGSPDIFCEEMQLPYSYVPLNDNSPISGDKFALLVKGEYLIGNLSPDIQKGQTYCYSFYAWNTTNEVINTDLGIALTNDHPKQCGYGINLTNSPQPDIILTNGQPYINPNNPSDNENWKFYSGTFTADDDFSRLIIGHFHTSFDDNHFFLIDEIFIGENCPSQNEEIEEPDEPYVDYNFNICCPPINQNSIESLFHAIKLNSFYKMSFNPTNQFIDQMQEFTNYLGSINQSTTNLIFTWRIMDMGDGSTPLTSYFGNGQIGSDVFMSFETNGDQIAGLTNFFSPNLNYNHWYKIHVGLYLNDGIELFDLNCSDNNWFNFSKKKPRRNRRN